MNVQRVIEITDTEVISEDMELREGAVIVSSRFLGTVHGQQLYQITLNSALMIDVIGPI